MYDGVLLLCESIVYKFSASGEVQSPKGFGHPALSPFDVYETKDGGAAIAAPKDEQWQALCEVIGRPDLVEDERTVNVLVRASHRELVNEAILAWTRQTTTQEVVVALARRVPVGPVNNAADIFADPHAKIRGMLVEIEQPGNNRPITLAGPPIKFTGTPSAIYRRPPNIGEHSDEILAEAGIRPAAKEQP
jgi:crotonobetainyl-CoA:carnitine CoA-transferase CaiB-like acyl-CoA transferase